MCRGDIVLYENKWLAVLAHFPLHKMASILADNFFKLIFLNEKWWNFD